MFSQHFSWGCWVGLCVSQQDDVVKISMIVEWKTPWLALWLNLTTLPRYLIDIHLPTWEDSGQSGRLILSSNCKGASCPCHHSVSILRMAALRELTLKVPWESWDLTFSAKSSNKILLDRCLPQSLADLEICQQSWDYIVTTGTLGTHK